ncbi:MAG: hypothetical protein IT388_11930 [Nitrospirales bacterium]|nr:hypothetical protein [Nitrospirales bacterium]
MALEGQGVKFYWSTSTAASTAQKVGEVTGFNGPSGTASVIDVTNLDSTAKEKLIGLRDEGQISLDLSMSAADTGQVALRADRASRTKRAWVIQLTDTATTYIRGKGYCLGFSISGSVDNKIAASANIEITGALTYSTALA